MSTTGLQGGGPSKKKISDRALEIGEPSCLADLQPILDSDKDYKSIVEKYQKASRDFGTAKKTGAFDGTMASYMDKAGIQDPKSGQLVAAKNYSLISNELAERKANGSKLSLIAIDISDLERSLSELLESVENTELIKEIYRTRKQTTKDNGGISSAEAAKIKHFFYQGGSYINQDRLDLSLQNLYTTFIQLPPIHTAL